MNFYYSIQKSAQYNVMTGRTYNSMQMAAQRGRSSYWLKGLVALK